MRLSAPMQWSVGECRMMYTMHLALDFINNPTTDDDPSSASQLDTSSAELEAQVNVLAVVFDGASDYARRTTVGTRIEFVNSDFPCIGATISVTNVNYRRRTSNRARFRSTPREEKGSDECSVEKRVHACE